MLQLGIQRSEEKINMHSKTQNTFNIPSVQNRLQ